MDIQLESLRIALADKMGSVLTPELAASIIFTASTGNVPPAVATIDQSKNDKK